jgi:hypothetical protein
VDYKRFQLHDDASWQSDKQYTKVLDGMKHKVARFSKWDSQFCQWDHMVQRPGVGSTGILHVLASNNKVEAE